MKIAVCPGSFDPITNGHLDIIRRASGLFDQVIVTVLPNATKNNGLFTPQERVALIDRVLVEEKLTNVTVDMYDGLLADYVRDKNANVIIKGLRALSDFEYEFQMALTNRKLNAEAETMFLTTTAENMYLSSSLVKQVAGYGGDIQEFVPACVLPDILKKFGKECVR